jgi:hypothetical protein
MCPIGVASPRPPPALPGPPPTECSSKRSLSSCSSASRAASSSDEPDSEPDSDEISHGCPPSPSESESSSLLLVPGSLLLSLSRGRRCENAENAAPNHNRGASLLSLAPAGSSPATSVLLTIAVGAGEGDLCASGRPAPSDPRPSSLPVRWRFLADAVSSG